MRAPLRRDVIMTMNSKQLIIQVILKVMCVYERYGTSYDNDNRVSLHWALLIQLICMF